MPTGVEVMGKTVDLHTLHEIGHPEWLSRYWQILCSIDPSKEIEEAKKDSNLPLFLMTNPFRNPIPERGNHVIQVGKPVFVPISVSEFDEVEMRHFNLGNIKTPQDRLAYARDEYELAIDKPKQLSINGHRILDREGIYGPYYSEVISFELEVNQNEIYDKFDIPYEKSDIGKKFEATILGHCVVLGLPEGDFHVSSYSEGPFGEWTACNYLIRVDSKN